MASHTCPTHRCLFKKWKIYFSNLYFLPKNRFISCGYFGVWMEIFWIPLIFPSFWIIWHKYKKIPYIMTNHLESSSHVFHISCFTTLSRLCHNGQNSFVSYIFRICQYFIWAYMKYFHSQHKISTNEINRFLGRKYNIWVPLHLCDFGAVLHAS